MFENLILNNIPKRKINYNKSNNHRKVYIETYGCQMNLSDTEIILSVMSDFGFNETNIIEESDVILLNTCSVRENAEKRIFNRLANLKKFKKNNPEILIGILGCMAERLKNNLLEKEKLVDLIVGPDEYRKLPNLIENTFATGEKGIAVKLSKIETYDDIIPVRKDGISAWVTVMRGCDKFCSFCVVPFTRGRERSRKIDNIINEIKNLEQSGVKDIWLLGQNVNSYKDGNFDFSDLIGSCAEAVKSVRIRFTTSHPYDLSNKLLETISGHKNISKYIHLPVQSGSDRILKLMNRLYTVKQYLRIIEYARKLMPNIGLSTDIITGYPSETEDDHNLTLNLLNEIQYDNAYMFAYSLRENTKSFSYPDDVKAEIKKRRLEEIIDLQRKISIKVNSSLIGKTMEVLIESVSKKSPDFLMGRTDCNKSTIVSKIPQKNCKELKIGEFVNLKIFKANSATLFGEVIE
jgi:tRNA-2-methylthio-N6-dimethylallyladenosine synthase